MTVCTYHVTYAYQSESTLYNCLNVKELLARNRRHIWNLSGCNGTRTHNHLVCKWTFNHLAKLAKWLSFVVSTYLYGAFDCGFTLKRVRDIIRTPLFCWGFWTTFSSGWLRRRAAPSSDMIIVEINITRIDWWVDPSLSSAKLKMRCFPADIWVEYYYETRVITTSWFVQC